MAGQTPALLTELRQMAEKGQISEEQFPHLIFALQIDLIEEVRALTSKVDDHTHDDYVTTEELEALKKNEIDTLKAQLADTKAEVAAWTNRAIGIGIGAALAGVAGGTGAAALLFKIFGGP